jgi:hypothetical protein
MMPTVRTVTIAGGDLGIMQTLDEMRGLIEEGTADPLTVGVARNLAVRAVGPFGERGDDQARQAVVIRNWLASVWRFVRDPMNRELGRNTSAMLLEYQDTGTVMGDCDEAAILGASLGLSIGIQPTLTVLEFEGQEIPGYSHVYATLLPDNAAGVTLDVTRRFTVPVGAPVPPVSRLLTIAV